MGLLNLMRGGCSTAGEVESSESEATSAAFCIPHHGQIPRRNESFCAETETGDCGGRKGLALHKHGLIYPDQASEPVRLPEVLDGRGWLRRPRMSRGYGSSGKLQEPRRRATASGSADIPDQRLHPEARALRRNRSVNHGRIESSIGLFFWARNRSYMHVVRQGRIQQRGLG